MLPATNLQEDGKDKEAADADKKEHARVSRKMLASAQTVPEALKEKFVVPEGVSIYHTTHVDATLPLFQFRLTSGSHEGKCLDLP